MRIYFLVFCLIISSLLSGQNSDDKYSVTIQVVDEDQNPIRSAFVTIRQKKNETRETRGLGNVYFEDVPEGTIDIFILKPGYIPLTQQKNVTDEEPDNNFIITLERENNNLIIFGEVENPRGQEIENAEVILKIGSLSQSTRTDKYGDYSFDISLKDLSERGSEVEIKVKVTDCGEAELKKVIPVNEPELRADVTVSCNSNNAGQVNEVDDIRFELRRVYKRRNKVICEFSMTNLNSRESEKDIFIQAGKSRIIDQNGIECTDNLAKIGSKIDDEPGRVPVYGKLPYKVPVRSMLEFPTCDLESSFENGLSFLQINCNRDESLRVEFYDVKVEEQSEGIVLEPIGVSFLEQAC